MFKGVAAGEGHGFAFAGEEVFQFLQVGGDELLQGFQKFLFVDFAWQRVHKGEAEEEYVEVAHHVFAGEGLCGPVAEGRSAFAGNGEQFMFPGFLFGHKVLFFQAAEGGVDGAGAAAVVGEGGFFKDHADAVAAHGALDEGAQDGEIQGGVAGGGFFGHFNTFRTKYSTFRINTEITGNEFSKRPDLLICSSALPLALDTCPIP